MPAQTFDTVPHILLVAHGAMSQGEVWSCGLRTANSTAVPTSAVLQTLANAAAASWATFAASSAAKFSSTTTLSGVTARYLDSRGITIVLAEGLPPAATVGAGSQALPNQCAVALTLLTARAGRTGKGRIYLPVTGSQVGADGLLPSAIATALLAGAKTLIDSINTSLSSLPGGPKVAIQSKSAAANLGEGYTGAVVTGIQVGNVVDTQRRRRDSIRETYLSAAIA